MSLEETYNFKSQIHKEMLERAKLRNSDNPSTQDYSDSVEVWQPIKGFGFYDSIETKSHYKSFAYACIKKRAMNITKGNIYLYKEFKSKRNEVKADHPFFQLINRNNSFGQSFKEILFLSSCNCDLKGNGYVAVDKVDFLGSSLPVNLTPIPAKYVTIHLNSQNTSIEFYECVINGKSIKILPENMIRFKIPNPESNILGHAPVSAFNFTLDIDFLMNRTQRKFFDNYANLGTVIETPAGTSERTREKLDNQLQSQYAGSHNAHKGMVLSAGLKVAKTSENNREMDYVKSRQAIRDEICVILDTDKTVMNISDDVNYNNSKSALRNWIENNISPFMGLVFAPPLTQFLKDNYDKRLICEFDYEFATDREMQLKSYENARKYSLKTINQIRELEGDEPSTDPRADDLFAPLNGSGSSASANPDVAIEDIKQEDITNN
jgi:HK97 family phage portal protein